MNELSNNDVSKVASKVGRFIIIGVLIQVAFSFYLNESLVNLLHNFEPLSESDPIEIYRIIRGLEASLPSIIIGLFYFKVNIKDIFSNKNQIYKLSLKAKTKLTVLFISIAYFSAIVSSFIMVFYAKHTYVPIPKTTYFFSIYTIFVAPIIEEILHRRIITGQLKSIGYLFSIVISSIYFGFGHGCGFLHAFIIGLILGFCFILTGNIRWTIIIHFIYNLTLDLIGDFILVLSINMNYNIVLLIIAIILFSIFLITGAKDKELKELHKKVNIKNIINQFKKDKGKYVVFLKAPEIVILIFGWIFTQLILPFMVS